MATKNIEKDPSVYAFEVTDQMFEFMELRFDISGEDELNNGLIFEFAESE